MVGEHDARNCQAHLRLAQGFMETAKVNADSSECGVRSALSRSYYAVFHASRAWLITRAVPLSGSKNHRWLQKLIGKHRGRRFRDRLTRLYILREDSDYRPEMFSGSPYGGEIEKFRVIAVRNLHLARAEFDWYVTQTRQSLAG